MFFEKDGGDVVVMLINSRVVNFQKKEGGELLFLIQVKIKQRLTIVKKDMLKVFASTEHSAIKISKENIREIYGPSRVRISIVSIRKILNPGLEDTQLKYFSDSH